MHTEQNLTAVYPRANCGARSTAQLVHGAFIRFRTHLSLPLPATPQTRRNASTDTHPNGTMTFPSNADADPDPTTQMAWPSSRRNASGSKTPKSNYGGVRPPQTERGPLKLDPATGVKIFVNPAAKKRLTTKDLIFLSISMAGAQIAWTVELGYVFNCFCLSLLYVAFGCLCVAQSPKCLRTLRVDMARHFY